ncbi:GNAT family N-acetyltransferase [Angustibacter aerolatus]
MADDGVHLRAMSDDEVREYVQRIEVEYAEDMHTNGGLTLEVARERARASTEELAPEGRFGPEHRVWVAEDDDGERVGVLWLARRETGTADEHAWVYDIEVDAARRGQGWGRRLLAAAEAESRAWGQTSLRLNVFGGNAVARRLYTSAGFAESSITMTKALDG